MRFILEYPLVYSLFLSLVGAKRARRNFIRNIVQPKDSDKILDAGCGPGTLVPLLKSAEYVGYDVSEKYIRKAQEQFRDRPNTHFALGDSYSLFDCSLFRDCDTVISCGVLHHIDDEAAEHLSSLAHTSLKTGGRFLCFEPCFVPNQGFLSTWATKKDRGQHVRTVEGYYEILSKHFSKISHQKIVFRFPLPGVGGFFTCIK